MLASILMACFLTSSDAVDAKDDEAPRLIRHASAAYWRVLTERGLPEVASAAERLSGDVEDLQESVGDLLDEVHSRRRMQRSDNSLITAVRAFNLSELSPEDRVSAEKCVNDIEVWMNDTAMLQLYALQMADSWASKQGGMLEGNVRWTGQYWECVGARSDKGFSGKYCTTYYGFYYEQHAGGIPCDVTFDSCFPDSCSSETIGQLTTSHLHAQGTLSRLPALETTCSYVDDSYGAFEIVIIVVSVLLLMMACAGTGYDIATRNGQTPTEKRSGIMLSFSVLENGRKILSTRKSSGNIAAINGIRVISTLWVMLGHSLFITIGYLENTLPAGKAVRQSFWYLAVTNATVSVDTFFCMSGLLCSYLTLKSLKRSGGKMNVPLMYLHRYLRLTPAYAYALLFSVGVYKFLGAGPRWSEEYRFHMNDCDQLWWTNLLYINNLYPVNNYCFPQSWYLGCDMQFYLLAPLFIYTLYRWPPVGVVQNLVVIGSSIGVTWWLSLNSEQQPITVFQSRFFSLLGRIVAPLLGSAPESTYQDRFNSDTYLTPWCRIGAYLIGVLAGFVLHRTECKLRMPKVVVALGWLLTAGTGLSIVYGLYGPVSEMRKIDTDVSAFYNAVHRPLWSVCIAWVIVACTCGYGGPVTAFLDWSAFLPLSRLTYAMYLVHYSVINWYVSVQERYFRYSAIWLAYSFSGHVVITMAVSLLLAIFVEWPCQELLRVVMPTGKPRPKPAAVTETPMASSSSSSSPPSYTTDEKRTEMKIDMGRINDAFASASDGEKNSLSTNL